MTVFEILNFNKELLIRLKASGIRLEDAKYVDLFVDFNELISCGNKVSYAVAVLSDRFHVSESKVYSLIKHFQSDCKAGAV